jgi:hypothetical protein
LVCKEKKVNNKNSSVKPVLGLILEVIKDFLVKIFIIHSIYKREKLTLALLIVSENEVKIAACA